MEVLEEKKAEDIVLLDIQAITVVADYFVICTATSNRMLDALLDAVVDSTKKKYKRRPRVEGLANEGWLLADYGDLIVHIFSPGQRSFYRLEELWSEGRVLVRLQ